MRGSRGGRGQQYHDDYNREKQYRGRGFAQSISDSQNEMYARGKEHDNESKRGGKPSQRKRYNNLREEDQNR